MPASGNGEATVTTDHKTIREWVESRGGHPASVEGTAGKSDAGLLRIDYPGYRGKASLTEISWDEFFGKFEEKKLAFLYQERSASGRESRFSKLITRRGAERRDRARARRSGADAAAGGESRASRDGKESGVASRRSTSRK